MRTLFLDCGMGAAGDMLTAALLELLPEPEAFIAELNSLGLENVSVSRQTVSKCGIQGTHVTVKVQGQEEHSHDHGHQHAHTPEHAHEHHHEHGHEHEHEHEHHHEHTHEHHHSGMSDIERIISKLPVSAKVQDDVRAVYSLIAEAESQAHGVPVSEIHFHEVGTMDAIADVTAVCLLLERIAPEQIIVSPVHVGCGQVHCAHGILPVPAPATAHILRDVPIYGGSIRGELCTPTGAALLKHFASQFGAMPIMRPISIGYGMGTKDFPAANCLRAILGDTEDSGDTVIELRCNLDDMTAEALGFAAEILLERGALDVYTQPIQMKRSRPGTMLTVMCREADRSQMVNLLFQHTSTIGIRETVSRRYTLERRTETVNSPYGEVRKKISSGYGVVREKYEYQDVATIARERNISIQDVLNGLGQ